MFPDACPPDSCPPADATDCDQVVFHFLKCWPPNAKRDGVSHLEKVRKDRTGDLCQRCGLSVYPSEGDARERYRELLVANPGLEGNWRYIGRAVLKPHHGKLKQTGRPPHLTWWPFKTVDRCSVFTEKSEL